MKSIVFKLLALKKVIKIALKIISLFWHLVNGKKLVMLIDLQQENFIQISRQCEKMHVFLYIVCKHLVSTVSTVHLPFLIYTTFFDI